MHRSDLLQLEQVTADEPDKPRKSFRDELASDVTKTAAQVAKKVLNKNYSEVQGEIGEVLRQYGSPLDRVRDAFVASHEDSVRRSDAKKRRAIIEDIDAALAHAPRLAQ